MTAGGGGVRPVVAFALAGSFASASAFACVEEPLELQREQEQEEEEEEPLCELVARPSLLSFGVVQQERTLVRTLSLSNEGAVACGVEAVHARGINLDVQVEPLPRVLQPGEELQVRLFIQVASEELIGTIEIWLANAAVDHLEIPVYGGSGGPAALLVVPHRVTFANPPRCGREWRTITIYNTSDEAVRLERPRMSSGAGAGVFALRGEPAGVLAPGEQASFEVSHLAGGGGLSARAAVELGWWPEGQSARVERLVLEAQSAPSEPQVDTFQTPADTRRTTTFVLQHTPDPATLAVAIDGGSTGDWIWDASANAVVFSPPAAPGPSTRVSARYRVACWRE